MSVRAETVQIPARFATARRAEAARPRVWLRVVSFAALALYGVDRWARLLAPAPMGRLLAIAGLGIALVIAVPLVRHLTAGRSRAHALGGRAAGLAAVAVAVLAAFPIAGLSWHSAWHLRIAVSAREIGDGLSALPNVLLPYVGHDHAVRLVFVLGAAVLVLDAAAVLAFAPRQIGDARRALAALPLIALAVVPATLVRPDLPVLQGVLLFALLAIFMWGERIGRDASTAAVGLGAVAALAAGVIAHGVDSHRPWLDYRSWTGAVSGADVDRFDWNQNYGPLRWPQSGHQVLTVRADRSDYWKAQDLSFFNGRAWVVGQSAGGVALPRPSEAALARFTQRVTVTITGLKTTAVIGGSGLSVPISPIPGGTEAGAEPGTLTAGRTLGPGTTYSLVTYSPQPNSRDLERASRRAYPWGRLQRYLTLGIPVPTQAGGSANVQFGRFHAGVVPRRLDANPGVSVDATALVQDSPYGQVYEHARLMSLQADSPYDYVAAVKRFLSHGFTYSQNPPAANYPLASFLLDKRLGYCQQFSGAMAMMLRMGGVPARVAGGFTSGAFNNQNHTWAVSDIDAHAWVEAWFPRYGWVKFDPTPSSAPARGGNGTAPIQKRLPNNFESPSGAKPQATTKGATPSGGSATTTARQGSAGTPWGIIAGVAAALVALAGLGWWRLRRSGRDDDLVAELERALARTGRPLRGGMTLAGLEHRFRSSPDAAGYVRTLRLSRYGAAPAAPTRSQRRALRYELRVGLGPIARLRAWWALPPRLRRRRRHGP